MLLKKKQKNKKPPKTKKNKPNRSMRKTKKGIYTPPSKNKKTKSQINNLTQDLKESESTKPTTSSQQEGNNKDQEENKLRLKTIEKKRTTTQHQASLMAQRQRIQLPLQETQHGTDPCFGRILHAAEQLTLQATTVPQSPGAATTEVLSA